MWLEINKKLINVQDEILYSYCLKSRNKSDVVYKSQSWNEIFNLKIYSICCSISSGKRYELPSHWIWFMRIILSTILLSQANNIVLTSFFNFWISLAYISYAYKQQIMVIIIIIIILYGYKILYKIFDYK